MAVIRSGVNGATAAKSAEKVSKRGIAYAQTHHREASVKTATATAQTRITSLAF